jgi:hypothetical protein
VTAAGTAGATHFKFTFTALPNTPLAHSSLLACLTPAARAVVQITGTVATTLHCARIYPSWFLPCLTCFVVPGVFCANEV